MGSGAYNSIAQQDLASVGLRKFVHELRTGRMIAFFGSGATRSHGYDQWNNDFIEAYWKSIKVEIKKAGKTASELGNSGLTDTEREDIARAIIDERKDDIILTLDLLDNLYGISRDFNNSKLFTEVRKLFAKRFSPETQVDDDGMIVFPTISEIPDDENVLRVLFSRLLIRRVMTLNYDVEAEIAFIRRVKKCSRENAIGFWRYCRKNSSDDTSREVTVDFPGGYRLSSLIAQRDRTDRIVEFALGTPDRKVSILHLHGREDCPNTLIASKRDYRNLYWRKDLSKPLVDQSLKAVFIGNPILHIGIGMGEADVTRTLEQFMSDTPLDVEFPRFILKETFDTEAKNEAYRLKMFHDFGVYTIFDLDLAQVVDGVRPKIQNSKQPSNWISKTMVNAVCNSRIIMKQVGDNHIGMWKDHNFCIENPQLSRDDGFPRSQTGMQIWKAAIEPDLSAYKVAWYDPDALSSNSYAQPETSSIFDSAAKDALAARYLSSDISVLIAEPGIGKGLISRIVHEAAQSNGSGQGAHRSILINAAFAMETDGIFSILTGAVTGRTAAERNKSRRDAFQTFLDSTLETLRIAIDAAMGEPTERLTIIVNGMERFLSDDGEPLSIEVDNFFRQFAKRLRAFNNEVASPGAKPGDRSDFLRLVLIGTNRVRRYVTAIFDTSPPTFRVKRTKDGEPYKGLIIDRVDGDVGEDPRQARLWITNYPGDEVNYARVLITAAQDRANNFARRIRDDANIVDDPALMFREIETVEERLTTLITDVAEKTDRTTRRRLYLYMLSADIIRLPSRAIPSRLDIDTDLCLLIIRALAFIGQPMERSIFDHILDIVDHETDRDRSQRRHDGVKISLQERKARIPQHIDHLIECRIILLLAPFDRKDDPEKRRVALHKSAVAEIRERYGIPLSDARMTNSFNLTLFAAQPAEGYVPEKKWHRILSEIAANLVNAYRDDGFETDAILDLVTDQAGRENLIEALTQTLNKAGHIKVQKNHIPRLATREMAACLRAAYLLIRSYYSSASMIMMTDTEQTQNSPSELKKLARRLKRLIDVTEQHTTIRNYLLDTVPKDHSDALKQLFGKPAFYPDDLVWIYNEIGVIETLLGRLYRARDSINKAHFINDNFVEFDRRQVNWRFLTTNMLQIRLNRGRLQDMDHSLRELRESIEETALDFYDSDSSKLTRGGQPIVGPLDHIVELYGKDGEKTPARIDRRMPRDLILNTALYMGYRAIYETLSGAYDTALAYYENCASITNRIGERRAYSLFQRHHALLLKQVQRKDDASRVLQMAINASGSIRQADINRFSRTIELNWNMRSEVTEPEQIIPALKEALAYARRSDNYTLQIQALASLADRHRESGDFDAAVAAHTDAIALAARFGHGLRKIKFRVSLAMDYCQHQEPHLRQSAIAFAESATRIGTNVGYSTLVDQAQTIKVDINSGQI